MSTVSTAPRAIAAVNPASDTNIGRLVVSCTDGPGIVSRISAFLHHQDANIVQSDQYSTGPRGGQFFLRIEFQLPDLEVRLAELECRFAAEVAQPLDATFRLRLAAAATRVAIFASRYDHCLLDLLWRTRRGDLPITVVQVVSNHPDLAGDVARFGVPFEHIPVTKNSKPWAEQRQLDVLQDRIDLVVLARYMQILSGDFLDRVGVPVINIHHSFLPAFVGASPYQQAKARGVKLIGATAHYATEDLDDGPIIEQDVVRVTHKADIAELARQGAEIERTVLARAVGWHCEDRVLVNGRTTIVF